MSAHSASNPETRAGRIPDRREKQTIGSPGILVIVLALAVFAVEFVVMLLVPWQAPIPQPWASLLDAALLTILLLPLLYFLLWRPLQAQVIAAEQTAEMLRIRSTALEAAAHGVLITDPQGRILWCNPAFTRMTGYRAEEVIGKTPQILRSDRHDAAYFAELWRAILAGRVWDGETVNRRKDGSTYFEEQTIAPVLDLAGKITHFVAIKYDCTPRKIAEADLAQRNTELAAANAAERKQRELAEALVHAAAALNNSLDRDVVLDRILEQVQTVVPCAAASVGLIEGNKLVVVRRRTPENGVQSPHEIVALDQYPMLQKVVESRQPFLTEDLAAEPGRPLDPHRDWIRSMVACPLLEQSRVVGLFIVLDATPGIFDQETVRALSAFAIHAQTALQNARLFGETEATRERMQALSRYLVEIQEAERRHVARELHDEAGQALTVLKIGLNKLERDAANPDAVAARVAELRQVNDDVLESLHRLARSLRPASLDHLGLVPALAAHITRMDEQHGPRVSFRAIGIDMERLPANIETALYRLAVEALTNVFRHANASRVDVLLERRDGKILLLVEDDGQGFDSECVDADQRLGLLGMRERCEMFGGTFYVESAPGSGTTIVGEIPLGDSHSGGG